MKLIKFENHQEACKYYSIAIQGIDSEIADLKRRRNNMVLNLEHNQRMLKMEEEKNV